VFLKESFEACVALVSRMNYHAHLSLRTPADTASYSNVKITRRSSGMDVKLIRGLCRYEAVPEFISSRNRSLRHDKAKVLGVVISNTKTDYKGKR